MSLGSGRLRREAEESGLDHAETSGNLPPAGAITLDHSGHFVPDAEQARTALAAAGFTVTPFSAQVQPDPESGEPTLTGTGNVCVMLARGYLEFLVQTADTPLGQEFREALNRRAGLHLAAFGVADAAERHATLSANGHRMRPLVRMSREIDTEYGGTETARFVVARLDSGAMPEGRVQLVTHRSERAMWQLRWTHHANGAERLAALVLSAPEPREAAERFARFLGREPVARGDGAYVVDLDRGRIEILPEAAATALVGEIVDPGRPAFAACRIGVSDPGRTRTVLDAGEMDYRTDEGGNVVVPFPDPLGRGAWIFEGPDQSDRT